MTLIFPQGLWTSPLDQIHSHYLLIAGRQPKSRMQAFSFSFLFCLSFGIELDFVYKLVAEYIQISARIQTCSIITHSCLLQLDVCMEQIWCAGYPHVLTMNAGAAFAQTQSLGGTILASSSKILLKDTGN